MRIAGTVRLGAVGVLLLAACGSGSDREARIYEGQWKYVGGGMVEGPDLLNLRADGQFSDVVYASGTIGDPSDIIAWKGMYAFVPFTPGDDTEGMLAFVETHSWETGAWTPLSYNYFWECVITDGAPKTMDCGDLHYEYYGPEAPIPTGF